MRFFRNRLFLKGSGCFGGFFSLEPFLITKPLLSFNRFTHQPFFLGFCSQLLRPLTFLISQPLFQAAELRTEQLGFLESKLIIGICLLIIRLNVENRLAMFESLKKITILLWKQLRCILTIKFLDHRPDLAAPVRYGC